ncbi:MAG: response regulator [Spirochaetes bacterium]|nr:response regulator [Spirochaetota bacterium]
MNILLVEDNYEFSKMVKDILEINNFIVDQAFNGQEAFRKAIENNYDLIIMDIFMPLMRGDECIYALYSVNPLQKFLIISGDIENLKEDEINRLKNMGVIKFYKKPINFNEFIRDIKELFNNE